MLNFLWSDCVWSVLKHACECSWALVFRLFPVWCIATEDEEKEWRSGVVRFELLSLGLLQARVEQASVEAGGSMFQRHKVSTYGKERSRSMTDFFCFSSLLSNLVAWKSRVEELLLGNGCGMCVLRSKSCKKQQVLELRDEGWSVEFLVFFVLSSGCSSMFAFWWLL